VDGIEQARRIGAQELGHLVKQILIVSHPMERAAVIENRRHSPRKVKSVADPGLSP